VIVSVCLCNQLCTFRNYKKTILQNFLTVPKYRNKE